MIRSKLQQEVIYFIKENFDRHKAIEVSCDEVSFLPVRSYQMRGFGVNTIKNLSFKNNSISGKSLTIDDGHAYFVIDLNSINSHYHFLIDSFLTPMYLKINHPELKIKILAVYQSGNGDVDTYTQLKSSLSRTIFSLLDNEVSEIVPIIDLNEYRELKIKKVFFMQTYTNTYLALNDRIRRATPIRGVAPSLIADTAKSVFASYIRPLNLNKKIFMSRSNARKDPEFEAIYRKFLSGEKLTMDEVGIVRPLSRGSDLRVKYSYRYISIDDEQLLENFYFNQGFEILDMESLSVYEQISVASESRVIAGLAGAAFVNTLVCNKESDILLLHISDGYVFEHELNSLGSGANTYHVPYIDRKSVTKKIFTINKIIDESKDVLGYISSNKIGAPPKNLISRVV